MSAKTTVSTSGLSLGTVVGIVFIILKLCKVITWSWLWVLCPFWIGIALWLGIIVLGAIVALIGAGVAKSTNKRKW